MDTFSPSLPYPSSPLQLILLIALTNALRVTNCILILSNSIIIQLTGSAIFMAIWTLISLVFSLFSFRSLDFHPPALRRGRCTYFFPSTQMPMGNFTVFPSLFFHSCYSLSCEEENVWMRIWFHCMRMCVCALTTFSPFRSRVFGKVWVWVCVCVSVCLLCVWVNAKTRRIK